MRDHEVGADEKRLRGAFDEASKLLKSVYVRVDLHLLHHFLVGVSGAFAPG